MLVNLYELDENYSYKSKLENIRICRLLSPNIHNLETFILQHFLAKGWASEIKAACYKSNPSVFIAINDKNEIVGFAGYDATCKGFFGPLGVAKEYRGKHIASDLIYACLKAMREEGYAYAIIGSVEEKVQPLYQKVCHAKVIEAKQTVYSRMI